MISHELLTSARLLLMLALDQRRQEVFRISKNHYSSYAPAVIVIVVTAFDAWLNELLGSARSEVSDDRLAEVIDRPTIDRYKEIASLSGASLSPTSALNILIKTRNEIVHYLPYAQDLGGHPNPATHGHLKTGQRSN